MGPASVDLDELGKAVSPQWLEGCQLAQYQLASLLLGSRFEQPRSQHSRTATECGERYPQSRFRPGWWRARYADSWPLDLGSGRCQAIHADSSTPPRRPGCFASAAQLRHCRFGRRQVGRGASGVLSSPGGQSGARCLCCREACADPARRAPFEIHGTLAPAVECCADLTLRS